MKRQPKKYDRLIIKGFLEMVKAAILQGNEGLKSRPSYKELTQLYKLGEGNTRYALETAGLVSRSGKKGFANWQWTGGDFICEADIDRFIQGLHNYSKTINRSKIALAAGKEKSTTQIQEPLFVEMPEEIKKLVSELTAIAQGASNAIAEIRAVFRKYN